MSKNFTAIKLLLFDCIFSYILFLFRLSSKEKEKKLYNERALCAESLKTFKSCLQFEWELQGGITYGLFVGQTMSSSSSSSSSMLCSRLCWRRHSQLVTRRHLPQRLRQRRVWLRQPGSRLALIEVAAAAASAGWQCLPRNATDPY